MAEPMIDLTARAQQRNAERREYAQGKLAEARPHRFRRLPAPTPHDAAELDDYDAEVLDFETTYPQRPNEGLIYDLMGCTPTAYYQRLNYLLDLPAAVKYAPQTVARCIRLRDQGRARRSYVRETP